MKEEFKIRLEKKVSEQIHSQKVGYLIGAGASYINGQGYPLASQLWDRIKSIIPEVEQNEIQEKLDSGAEGIEKALDLLDTGSVKEKPHRHLVTEAIATHFCDIEPVTRYHQNFVRRLSTRSEFNIPIFCLNYDGLIELACDIEHIRTVDGFCGIENPYFEPQLFGEIFGISHRGKKGMQMDWSKGIIHLYKLHGSLGWFQFAEGEVRKLGLMKKTPANTKRCMVPPQYRKGAETTSSPYSFLWSDFRKLLCHGPNILNRLVSIGYGFRDEHLNVIVENALARKNFILLIFAYELSPEVFARWSTKKNVIIVTKKKSSLYGETGPGHSGLWSFETLSERI